MSPCSYLPFTTRQTPQWAELTGLLHRTDTRQTIGTGDTPLSLSHLLSITLFPFALWLFSHSPSFSLSLVGRVGSHLIRAFWLTSEAMRLGERRLRSRPAESFKGKRASKCQTLIRPLPEQLCLRPHPIPDRIYWTSSSVHFRQSTGHVAYSLCSTGLWESVCSL